MSQLTDLQFTSIESIESTVAAVRTAYDSGSTQPLAWRMDTIGKIRDLCLAYADRIESALKEDLGRPQLEAWGADIGVSIADIEHTIAYLPDWVKSAKVPTPVALQPGTSSIRPEPLGVACVISPWNYPIQLSILPVVAAISAGNGVVLKPSEIAPASAAVLGQMIDELGDPAIAVVQGGVAETTRLLEQRFDHIFYTGNPSVGKIVMRAAAEHLTPVTLELGGKSPVIVTANANLKVAANRIAWGRWLNAGQTCLACDYVLVDPSVHDQLIDELRSTLTGYYGADPKQSADFGRIVNEQHFNRIEKLLGSGTVAIGGETDIDSLYIAPTVLTDVTRDDSAMQEEIFGPVLPVLTIGNVEEAIAFINADEKPLALYVFTEDEAEAERVLDATSSGAAVVNGSLVHAINPNLPFGGVGNSGMGAYHGKFGFDVFSHQKAVVELSTKFDPPIQYPPYTRGKTKIFKKAMLMPEPREVMTKVRRSIRARLPF